MRKKLNVIQQTEKNFENMKQGETPNILKTIVKSR